MHQGVKGENGDRQDQLHPGLFRTFDSDFDKNYNPDDHDNEDD